MRSMFTIIPAIDLKDGRCVRLRQGRADDVKVYGDDPVRMALAWEAEGAGMLHVVDLDGAFRGRPVHTEVIGRIAAAVGIPVEVGGGLRTDADIRSVLKSGVRRAIIGTRALAGPAEMSALAREFGAALAVGIDARDGVVQIRGWVESTAVPAQDLARQACEAGVATLIYTDTSTDGMLEGTNAAGVAGICDAASCGVVASGGISSAEDIRRLHALGRPNLVGAIVGKALYEGRVTLEELAAATIDSVEERRDDGCTSGES